MRPAPAHFPYFEHRTLAEVDLSARIDASHARMLGNPLHDTAGQKPECLGAAVSDRPFHASEVRCVR